MATCWGHVVTTAHRARVNVEAIVQETTFRTARRRVFNPITRAFRRMCYAEQIGLVYEELQPRNVRSSPLGNSPPTHGAARANILAQGSSPRRVGPCRHRCLSGSQIGMGAQAGQTAPALGKRTVSATSEPDQLEIIAFAYLDWNLSQRYHSSRGVIIMVQAVNF